MSDFYDDMEARNKGAWVVHHGKKTSGTVNGSAEFPALDAAGKAASLLSQLSSTDDSTVDKIRVDAFAKSAGLNPRIELPEILNMLERRRLIEQSSNGGVAVLGVTSRATVQYAADIFDEQDPTAEEQASVALAEITSSSPYRSNQVSEFISDQFRLSNNKTSELLQRFESIGFVDSEGAGDAKTYFNGNIFRRDTIEKTKKSPRLPHICRADFNR